MTVPVERSAAHESGHAVMASRLGVKVERVVLHPEGGGTCFLGPLPTDDMAAVKRRLLILAAGDAAEAVVELPALSWRL
jgi:hypothetical protein